MIAPIEGMQNPVLQNKVLVDVITNQFCIPLLPESNQTGKKLLLGTSVIQKYVPFDPSQAPIFIEEKILSNTCLQIQKTNLN